MPSRAAEVARRHAVESGIVWSRRGDAWGTPQHIEDRMRHYGIPGVSIAVIHNYQIVWTGYYGLADVARHHPVTARTRFLPGSVSKMLNAIAVLSLAADRAIDLDLDVNRQLHGWQLPRAVIAKARAVTPRQLLSHTAGVSVRGFWGYRRGDALPTLHDILDGRPPAINAPVRSIDVPGRAFAYAGGGTMILQALVEERSGKRYDAALASRILEPLGMRCSSFRQPPPASWRNDLAVGYTSFGAPFPGGHPIMPEQAAAGLWTTAYDLAVALLAVQRALGGTTTGPITPHIARQITSPVRAGSPGLGLFVHDTMGTRVVEHGAGNSGFSGLVRGLTSGGYGVAIVQNGESAALLEEIAATVAHVYRWPVIGEVHDDVLAMARRGSASVAVSPWLLERLPGFYREGDALAHITRRGDTLYYQAGERPWRMHFLDTLTFVNAESRTEKRVIVSARGLIGIDRVIGPMKRGRLERLPVADLSTDDITRLAGRYRHPRLGLLRLFVRHHDVLLERDGVAQPLVFVDQRQFVVPADFATVYRLIRDRGARVTAISVDGGAGPELAFRVGAP